MTYLNGGAYEFGSVQTANYFSGLLAGQFLRYSNGSSIPAYGSWDSNPMPSPPATPYSPSVGNGGIIMAFNPKTIGRAPYDSEWNLGIQRQLPWDMFVTVAYVGNRAIHVPSSLHQPEQPTLTFFTTAAFLASWRPLRTQSSRHQDTVSGMGSTLWRHRNRNRCPDYYSLNTPTSTTLMRPRGPHSTTVCRSRERSGFPTG